MSIENIIARLARAGVERQQSVALSAQPNLLVSLQASNDIIEGALSYGAGYWRPFATTGHDVVIRVLRDEGEFDEELAGEPLHQSEIEGTFLLMSRVDIPGLGSLYIRYRDGRLFDATILGGKKRPTIVVVGQSGPSPELAAARALRNSLVSILVADGRATHLHAAALEFGGSGVLLLGERRAGKTSQLCRLLCGGNASFISNDRTLLRSDGAILGLPVAVNLRAATLADVPALAGDKPEKGDLHNVTTRPEDDVSLSPCQFVARLGVSIRASVPLRYFIALRYFDAEDGVGVSSLGPTDLPAALCAHEFAEVDASQPFWPRTQRANPKRYDNVAGWCVRSGRDTLAETTAVITSLISGGRTSNAA